MTHEMFDIQNLTLQQLDIVVANAVGWSLAGGAILPMLWGPNLRWMSAAGRIYMHHRDNPNNRTPFLPTVQWSLCGPLADFYEMDIRRAETNSTGTKVTIVTVPKKKIAESLRSFYHSEGRLDGDCIGAAHPSSTVSICLAVVLANIGPKIPKAYVEVPVVQVVATLPNIPKKL